MSNITFTIELDSKLKKNGTQEIRIRMTQNRKHKRFNVGYALEKKHWNEEKKQVRSSHPLSIIINAAIQTRLNQIEMEYLKTIPLEKPITITELQRKAKVGTNNTGGDFMAYYRERIETYINGSTKRTMKRLYSKLETYLDGKTVHFSEINHEFLENYERYLTKLGNNANTTHHNIRTIRTIFNRAVKTRRYVYDGASPLYGYELKKGKSTRSKLTAEEIELIEKYETPQKSGNLFNSKNFFLLCYYLMGVRAKSMITMKWSNILGNRCIYTAVKGGKPVNVIIPEKAQEILRICRTNNINNSEYIFPFLKKGEEINYDSEADAKRIEVIESLINNNLRKIKDTLKIQKKLTTHVARHSFAYTARKKSGGDIYAVQKALGHSSIAITENYFNSDETVEADELSKLMFE